MFVLFYLLGAVSLIAGVGINVWVNRRRFYRRNASGLQQFSSYSRSVWVTYAENASKFFALLFVLIGAAMLLFAHKLQTDPDYGRVRPYASHVTAGH